MYEQQDEAKAGLIETRQEGEIVLGKTDNLLNEHKKDWDKTQKKAIKADADSLRKAISKTKPEKMTVENAGAIKEAKEKLEQTLASFGVSL